MKKYFYSNGENKNGPFSFEDLKNENITKETLIWFDGLDDWKPAKDIEELNEVFKLIPPPIIKNELLVKSENVERSSNNAGNYILTIVFGCIYTIVVENTIGNLLDFTSSLIGALVIPFGIAGIIILFTKKKFSQVLVWTTIIILTLSAIGQLSH